jgi:uncharacterized damage-inducible protein DinB
MTALTGEELIAWVEKTTQGWQRLVSEHPEALSFHCDIRESNSVGELLQHIVAVEMRYTQRLHDLPETPYEKIPFDSGEVLYATHLQAMTMLRELLSRDASFWEESIDFATRRGGTIRAPRRTILVHLLMHSIRHYAQLATLVRQHGIAPDWPMDYLFMRAKAVLSHLS